MLAFNGYPGYPIQGTACFPPPGKHEVIPYLKPLLQPGEIRLLSLSCLETVRCLQGRDYGNLQWIWGSDSLVWDNEFRGMNCMDGKKANSKTFQIHSVMHWWRAMGKTTTTR